MLQGLERGRTAMRETPGPREDAAGQRAAGELEAAVLAVLQAARAALSPGEVRDRRQQRAGIRQGGRHGLPGAGLPARQQLVTARRHGRIVRYQLADHQVCALRANHQDTPIRPAP
jgi:hypothetical protein